MAYTPLSVPPKLYDKRAVIRSVSFDKGQQGRPQDFALDMDHPLARGLVFGGLGRITKTTHYRDSSPYGNHGTMALAGMAADWKYVPYLGRASIIYALGSRINLPLIKIANDEVLTFSVWLNRTAKTGTYQNIFIGSATSPYGMQIYVAATSVFAFYANAGVTSTVTSTLGEWQHLLIVVRQTTGQIYSNGVLAQADLNLRCAAVTTGNSLLGEIASSTSTFNGQMADLMLWRGDMSAFSPQLANRSDPLLGGLIRPPSSPHFTGVTLSDAYTLKPPAVHVGNGTGRPQNFTLNQDHPLAKGLVFAGLGNAPGSVRYNDSTKQLNHGTLTAMDPATDWVWSSELGRLVLDFLGGTSNQSVAIGDAPSVRLTGAMSLGCWCKLPDASASWQSVMMKGAYSSTGSFGIFIRPSSAVMYIVRDGTYGAGWSTTGIVTWTNWNHFEIVLDGTYAYLFVNGKRHSTVLTQSSSGTSNTYSVYIGSSGISGDAYEIGGMLSDPTLHNRALSPAEIQILANRSDPMLGGLIIPTAPPPIPLAINDRHWVGRTSDWHSADNWSRSQNARGGAGVPNSNTNVFFDE